MREQLGKRVMIVGGGTTSGGREAALADKYSQSPQVDTVYVWPGNDLIWVNTQVPSYSFPGESVTDLRRIAQAAKDLKIDLVDVASEVPLAKGVVEELQKRKITTFGAASGVAKLESDKAFSRREQQRVGLSVPKWQFERRTNRDYLHRALGDWYDESNLGTLGPSVIKANGLAEGKGVYVADSLEEAHFGLDYVLNLPQGWQSGVLFEEKVGGPNAMEWSDFFLSGRGPDTRISGSSRFIQWYNYLGGAQDNKRLLEGDLGLNTGGMGAVSMPIFVQIMHQRLWREAYSKIINGLTNFSSAMILYASFMYDPDLDKIWLIEFNTRHGDPEAQVVLPGLDNDYFDLIYNAATQHSSHRTRINFHKTSRLSAAVVTQGYPQDYSANLGQPIRNLIEVIEDGVVKVYGAGAKQVGSRFVTGAGRNLHLVADAEHLMAAEEKLHSQLARLGGPIYYRRDIAAKEKRYIDNHYEEIQTLYDRLTADTSA